MSSWFSNSLAPTPSVARSNPACYNPFTGNDLAPCFVDCGPVCDAVVPPIFNEMGTLAKP
jgi:hypothetical protein